MKRLLPKLPRRPRKKRKKHPPPGAQPGTLVVTPTADFRIHICTYDASSLEEVTHRDVDGISEALRDDGVVWIDIEGIPEEHGLRRIAEIFGLHPLALEDIVNIPQRPKMEIFENHTLLILRTGHLVDHSLELERDQISLLVGPNYVLSFHEQPRDTFAPVRHRLHQGGPNLRANGPGYLTYALADAMIDGYYPIMEQYGDALERYEHELLNHHAHAELTDLYKLRRELITTRRHMMATRDIIHNILSNETPHISNRHQTQWRDCLDHCAQLVDMTDISRESIISLQEVQLAMTATRQNEVMKTLTILASIFIPLTFIAGIYGMNFKDMPELDSSWGYPAVLMVMAVMAGGMVYYFYRKGWLGGAARDDIEF